MKTKHEYGFLNKAYDFFTEKIIGIEKLIIFELDLEKPINKIPIKTELSLRIGSEKDIDSMDDRNYAYDKTAKQFSKDRLAKGDRCILAIKNGKIIGYAWFMKNKMELSVSNHIALSSKKAYFYKNFVKSEFRGKRVLNAIDFFLIDLLKEEGKRFIVTNIAIYNKSAIKARERLGFKRIGKIIKIRFFGIKYDFISKKDLKYLQSP